LGSLKYKKVKIEVYFTDYDTASIIPRQIPYIDLAEKTSAESRIDFYLRSKNPCNLCNPWL